MGVITKTIGSAGGRDYSDLTSWAAALPANLVTDGNSYVASMYADSEFLDTTGGSSPYLNLTGFTTDATHTITITAAAGQAWCDNTSSVGGYVAADGVAIRRTDHRSTVIECDVNFVTISRLQLSGGRTAINVIGDNATITNCVLETFNNNGVVNVNGGNGTIVNNFIIVNHASNGSFAIGIGRNGSNGPAVVVYNTIVRVSDYSAGDPVVGNHYGWSGTFTNNAFFGFSSTYDTAGMTGTNNGTDQSSVTGSSSDQVSLTYANQFTTTTTTGEDFRLKSGNSLAGNGITYTGISTDAYGTTRAGSPAIGAFEPSAGPSSSTYGITGTCAVAGIGSSQATTTGAVTGFSTVAGVGSSQAVTIGAANGTSAVAAVGSSLFTGTGTANGTSTVAATGTSQAVTTGSVTASAAVAATGTSQAVATGASAGTCAVAATGTSQAVGTVTIAASVSVSAAGSSSLGSGFECDGVAGVNALGSSTVVALVSITGTCTVFAISQGQALGGPGDDPNRRRSFDVRLSKRERRRKLRQQTRIVDGQTVVPGEDEHSTDLRLETVAPKREGFETFGRSIVAAKQAQIAQIAETKRLRELQMAEAERLHDIQTAIQAEIDDEEAAIEAILIAL